MEDINNILSSGQVPNLYRPEDMEEVVGSLGPEAKKAGIPETSQEVFKFFIERVRNNLHVILCASPIGDAFRNRIRQYPGFVNCTTIDWWMCLSRRPASSSATMATTAPAFDSAGRVFASCFTPSPWAPRSDSLCWRLLRRSLRSPTVP